MTEYMKTSDAATQAYTLYSAYPKYAQGFNSHSGFDLTQVALKLSKYGSPTGTATVSLVAVDSSGYPTGSDLASDTIDVATLTEIDTYYTFDLSYTLAPNTNYAIQIAYSGGDASNYVYVCPTTGAYQLDGKFSQYSSSWAEFTTRTLQLKISGTNLKAPFFQQRIGPGYSFDTTGWSNLDIYSTPGVPKGAIALISIANGNDAADLSLGVRADYGTNELWSEVNQDSSYSIYTATRAGQRVTFSSVSIKSVFACLKKFGSPTGTAYLRIRKVSDDSIISGSELSFDVSALTTSFVWKKFEYTSPVSVNEEVRVLIEYTGGTSGNYINLGRCINSYTPGSDTLYESGYTDTDGFGACLAIFSDSPSTMPLLNRQIRVHEAEGGGYTTTEMFVKVNESTGKIETFCSSLTGASFTLLGYWVGVDFTEDFTSLTGGGTTWQDAAETLESSKVYQILVRNSLTAVMASRGVRTNGSTLDRKFTLDEAEDTGSSWNCYSVCVKTDSSGIIELFSGSTTDYVCLGYFSSALDYVEKWTLDSALQTNKNDDTWTYWEFPAILTQLSASTSTILYNGVSTRAAQKITLNDTVKIVAFMLGKVGSPTGTGYVRIRKTSDDSVIAEKSFDVSTLATSPAWVQFEFSSAVTISEEVRVCVEFSGGDSSNYVIANYYAADLCAGVHCAYYEGWTDHSTSDAAIILLPCSRPVCDFVLAHSDTGAETNCGIRTYSAYVAPDRMIQVHEAEGGGCNAVQMPAEFDGTGYMSVRCGDNSESEFYFAGYFKPGKATKEITKTSDARVKKTQEFTKLSDAKVSSGATYEITKYSDARVKKTQESTKLSDSRVKKTQEFTKLSDALVKHEEAIVKNSDARISKTQEMSKTSDARIVVLREFTKTSDSRIKALKEFTKYSDADIKGTKEFTKYSDADVKGSKEFTKLSDARIVVLREFTKLSDARIVVPQAFNKLSDARILRTQEFTKPSDADIFGTVEFTKNSNARIVVLREFTKTADSRIKKLQEFTKLSDAKISGVATYEITKYSDARILKPQEFTKLSDGRVKSTKEITKYSDADVKGTKEFAKTADADIKGTKEFTKNSNARVLVTQETTKYSNANIVVLREFTKTSDARIFKTLEFTKPSDARIFKTQEFSKTSDAYITVVSTKEITKYSDTRIFKQQEFTKTSNALVKHEEEIVKTSDARILKIGEIVKNSDARIFKTQELSKTSDAKIVNTYSIVKYSDALIAWEYWSDARIKKPQEFTKTSDTRIKGTQAFTKFSDVRIFGTQSFTKLSDAKVISEITKTFTKYSDARIFSTEEFIKTSDARILQPREFTKTSDAKVIALREFTKTSDVRVKALKELTKLSDARIFKSQEFTKLSDARIKTLREFTKLSDAKITVVREITKLSDARIFKTQEITKLSDATIFSGKQFTKTSDARIKTSQEIIKYSDARIKKIQEIAKLSDARIKSTQEFTRTSDAYVLELLTKQFTKLSDAKIKCERVITKTSDARIFRQQTINFYSNARIVADKVEVTLFAASPTAMVKIGEIKGAVHNHALILIGSSGLVTLFSGTIYTPPSFDFGTMTSPVAVGYIRVSGGTQYSAGLGYGWDDPSFWGNDRDRGAPDDLRRDLNQTNVDRIFMVNLPAGTYEITAIIGDQSFFHDHINVYAEGNLVLSNLSNAAGEFNEKTFIVEVTDGRLEIMMSDGGGGTDPNWVLNALTIKRVTSPPDGKKIILKAGLDQLDLRGE